MTYEEWLDNLPIKSNPSGVRLDLSLYVYPDAHGNIVGQHGNQPVNNLDEAVAVLRDVWLRAQERAAQDHT